MNRNPRFPRFIDFCDGYVVPYLFGAIAAALLFDGIRVEIILGLAALVLVISGITRGADRHHANNAPTSV